MLEGEGIYDEAAKEPSQKLVAEHSINVYTSTPGQPVRNAWMKKWFEWF
jgi:hypothetical protein